MDYKQQLLEKLKQALDSGEVSESEVLNLLHDSQASSHVTAEASVPESVKALENANKLTAVEVMFYISGIILFFAIMAMIGQSWEANGSFTHIFLSAGIGSLLWIVAYLFHKQKVTSDIRKGMVNALVLTGSLCLIVGGFIITNMVIGGFNQLNLIPASLTFAFLGALHFAYDRIVRKDLMLLMAIILSVATFPSLLFGILQDAELPPDIWSVVFIGSVLTLPYATRLIAKMDVRRANLRRAFDALSAFLVLGTMFISTFSDFGIVWLVLLIGSVFGLYYLSIVMQNKHLLGNASFFLIVAVLEISFKYFSGAGVSVSLLVAAIGLLGSAAIATSINKKYFKGHVVEVNRTATLEPSNTPPVSDPNLAQDAIDRNESH